MDLATRWVLHSWLRAVDLAASRTSVAVIDSAGIDAPRTGPACAVARGSSSLAIPLKYRADPEWDPWIDGEPVARYTYVDENGRVAFENHRWHVRYGHPSYPDKVFYWRRWEEQTGSWEWGLEGVRLLPYRLPDVIRATRAGRNVFVVEGEKDVHALDAIGLTATTCPLGALQWTNAVTRWFAQAHVVILPDNDPLGHLHAARVAAALRGTAKSVVIVTLVGLRLHEDVTDWLQRGHTPVELENLAAGALKDPTDGELRTILNLPDDCPLYDTDPSKVLATVAAISDASRARDGWEFLRSRGRFARLDSALKGSVEKPVTYSWITDTLYHAVDPLSILLRDASLVERRGHELAALAPIAILMDIVAGGSESVDWGTPGSDLVRVPGLRVVRTQWDWDSFDASTANVPVETEASYLLRVTAERRVQATRLRPLASIILEECRLPQSRTSLVAAIADRVKGIPASHEIRELVDTQVAELYAAGLIRAVQSDSLSEMLARARRVVANPTATPTEAVAGAVARGVLTLRATIERHESSIEGALTLMMMEVWLGPASALFASTITRAHLQLSDGGSRDALNELCLALEAALEPRPGALPPLVLS